MQKPWFTIPPVPKHVKAEMVKRQIKQRELLAQFNELLKHEKLLRLSSWRYKAKTEETPKTAPVFDIKGTTTSKMPDLNK